MRIAAGGLIGIGVALLGAGPALEASGTDPPCIAGDCADIAVYDRWPAAERLRYGYGMTGRAGIALTWYLRSAEAGDPRAMHNAGLMLVRGEGASADPGQGRAWLERAAERGVAEALLALGDLDRLGIGAPPDPARARVRYGRAARRGHARAMQAYANMSARGEGGPVRLEEALFWYAIAARLGRVEAEAARLAAAMALPRRIRVETETRARLWRPGDD